MNKQLIEYEKAKDRVVLEKLTGYLKLNLQRKRILEIGCSTGALMELLEQHGADAYGVDIESEWSHAYYYKEDKRIFCDLQYQDMPAETGGFDLIIAQEVIEHIKRPCEFLSRICQLLNPQGKLFLTTPNLTGITSVVKGSNWCGISTQGHILLYSPKSLDFLLHNCGFRKLSSFTNLIPIVYQDRYCWLQWFNRMFTRTGIGGGIMALYGKLPTTAT